MHMAALGGSHGKIVLVCACIRYTYQRFTIGRGTCMVLFFDSIKLAQQGDGRIDWYRALGLSERATDRDIIVAYRKLALQFHPDKHVGLADGKHKQDLIRRFKVGYQDEF